MPCESFSMLDGPGGCTWHRKASDKKSSKLNKFLHSEVNLLIQNIIVQDQDGQNNNSSLQLNIVLHGYKKEVIKISPFLQI